MKTAPIVLERIYNAPIEQVWQAITNREQMKQWYFDLADFRAEKGFQFSFMDKGSDGTEYLHLCEVSEVIPNKKLTYSWRYDGIEGESFVTWELFGEGNRTRLKLTHEGLHTFPQGKKDFAPDSFIGGWTSIIGTSLKNYLEPGFKDRQIVVNRLLNAPVELVFEVWTKPDHASHWYGPDGFTVTTYNMDVRPGGEWNFVMHGPDGTDYPNKIAYSEVVKNERLVFVHGSGAPDGEGDFHVTVTFDAHGDKTMVTLASVFASVEALRKVVEEYGAIEGAKQTLGKLDAYLAAM